MNFWIVRASLVGIELPRRGSMWGDPRLCFVGCTSFLHERVFSLGSSSAVRRLRLLAFAPRIRCSILVLPLLRSFCEGGSVPEDYLGGRTRWAVRRVICEASPDFCVCISSLSNFVSSVWRFTLMCGPTQSGDVLDQS